MSLFKFILDCIVKFMSVCLVESWILLANKKKTLLEQFQNQTQKLQKEAKSVLITYIY
jgi:hypothetical protein